MNSKMPSAMVSGGRVADPSLAPQGKGAYEWAHAHMPALIKTIEKMAPKKPLAERRVGVCLHVTKETSVFVKGLMQLGAKVWVAAANPLSTQDEVAAFLLREGAYIYAWRGENPSEYFDCIRTILLSKPEFQVDDGADAHITAHEENLADGLIGGTEETTTGVTRLRALEGAGRLRYPIIAVNNAQSKYLFDNRYGSGQSTFDGILRATSLLIAGKRVVVAGYGWVGKGVARRAAGLGAHVIVVEVDPVKALEAHLDGFEVMSMARAARVGDLFITATGQTNVIRGEHIEEMRDGAILANTGHFDVEIDVQHLEQNSREKQLVRPHVERYLLKKGKSIYLVARGRVVNLVAAEGHPSEVMMMSFSNQLLSIIYLLENKDLPSRIINVPEAIDRQVAYNALEAWGLEIEHLTEEQKKYSEAYHLSGG